MRILLLDDDPTNDLKSASEALMGLGHEVVPFTDPFEFLEFDVLPTDVQVVDHKIKRLKRLKRGPRNGAELVAVSAAKRGPRPTVMLTNFKSDCTRGMNNLDPRIPASLAEKPTDSTSSSEWQAAIAPAIVRATEAFYDANALLGVHVTKLDELFFQTPIDDLHGMEDEGRDDLEISATHEISAQLMPIWSKCDASWVMLSTMGDEVLVLRRGNDGDLPTLDELYSLETEFASPCLIVGRPTMIEQGSLSPLECSPDGGKNWKRYPFARIVLGPHEREIHVDTEARIRTYQGTF